MDFARRFGGIARLYGDGGLAALSAASVCVVGVGGVGSWAVEALARSAVGRITLIDLDQVAESNINRQLPALDDEIGRAKVTVLSQRIAQINPRCEVACIEDFISLENIDQLVDAKHDWVLDCIDSSREKAALIAHCRRRGQSIVTVGGAGGRRDPSRIRNDDLRKTEQDPLLARTRRLLRQQYDFPRDPKRRFGVPCIWSDEPATAPVAVGACATTSDGSLNCSGLGSSMPVTAAFGLAAAAHAISAIAASG